MVLLRIYHELERRIDAFLRRSHIPTEVAYYFGPLGHGLDVQGAIAVGSPGSTLRVSLERAAKLQRAIQHNYRQSSELLARDGRVSKCFHCEEKQVARDESGSVRWKEGKLREWLSYRAERLYDINQRPMERPLDDKGRVSPDPDHWGVFTCGHLQLRAWSELVRAARLERAFGEIDAQQRLSIRYRTVPRLDAYSPELAETRRLVQGVFRPAPGKQFMVCHLKDLDLRCSALVAERHWQVGRLTQIFRDEEEPVIVFADHLAKRAATGSLEEPGDDEDNDLESSAPSRWAWARRITAPQWRELTKVLLRAVPRACRPDIRANCSRRLPCLGSAGLSAPRIVPNPSEIVGKPFRFRRIDRVSRPRSTQREALFWPGLHFRFRSWYTGTKCSAAAMDDAGAFSMIMTRVHRRQMNHATRPNPIPDRSDR